MKTQKLLLPLLAATAGIVGANDKYAIKAGQVITMNGDNIEDGVIVIEGGRITAVGTADAVKIPWDAAVLDAPEMTAAPGFVQALTNSGMDRPNETVELAPFLDVRDSIDPVSFFFEDSLRAGVTTLNVQQGRNCVIGGMGMVVQPYGLTVEEMLVRPRSGIVLSASPKSGKSRATQAQALRKAFDDLHRYLEQLVAEKRAGNDRARREALYQGRDLSGERGRGRAMEGKAWKVEGLELVPRGEIDEKQEPLLDLVEGNLDAYFYCSAAAEVRLALSIARDNGFLERTTLVLGPTCWKAADLIAEAHVPVILDPSLVVSDYDRREEKFKDVFIPKVFADKGITFALTPRNQSNESMWYEVATCVAHGMSRKDALAAATTTPAAMLKLADRVGVLKPGADGDVVLYSGDPLSQTSFVEYVVLDGRLVYDRSKDVRTRYLLEGVRPEGTSAEGAEEDHDHGEDPCGGGAGPVGTDSGSQGGGQ